MTLQLSSFGLKLPDSRTWISKRSENPSEAASASRCIYVTGGSGYFSSAYSALACFRMGTSGSASFQRAKKSWYAARALTVSRCIA